MMVLITSRSIGDAHKRANRIIDSYLPRRGDRCWSGFLSREGLNELRLALRRCASKNTAVAAFVIRSKVTKHVWTVGSRKLYSGGQAAVAASMQEILRHEWSPGPALSLLRRITSVSALIHDIGKGSESFAAKLAAAERVADAVRHEYVSVLVLRQLCLQHDGPEAGLLTELSTPEGLAARLKNAFEALGDDEALIADLMRPDANTLMPPDTFPLMHAIAWVAGTHHRAFDGGADEAVTPRHTVHVAREPDRAGVTRCLTPASGRRPLWEEDRWLARLSEAFAELASADATVLVDDVRPHLASLCRTALLVGDHVASSKGNRLSGGVDDRLYANTNRLDRSLAEPLADHLRSVARWTDKAFLALSRDREAWPAVAYEDLPETLAAPSSPVASRFYWQVEAHRLAAREARRHPAAGFFAVLMARTGAGKTRAAPSVLAGAASPGERFRYVLALGLRTLTLQSYDEYRDEIGFEDRHVDIKLGGGIVRRLHELERTALRNDSDVGTERDDDDVGFVTENALDDVDLELPQRLGALTGQDDDTEDARGRHTRAFLTAPVLVATLDSLMRAADGQRGSHDVAMLRLATSDLVLDEIDDYSYEDLAAISRLMYLTGLFGRRVMISSATVSPAIAEHLFRAYRDGWRRYALLFGADEGICAGWFSDTRAAQGVSYVESAEQFVDGHRRSVAAVVSQLEREPVRRRGSIINLDSEPDAATARGAIFSACVGMHVAHHVEMPDGRRLSVGMVRWANTDPCRQFARHVAEAPAPVVDGRAVEVVVVCYHSRFTVGARHKIEAALAKMLKRSANALAPLECPELAARVASSDAKDIMVIVSTTPIEEVGRDHDFDYAIVDPNAWRSVVQLAGRVLRHRVSVEPTEPNVALFSKPWRYLANQWAGAANAPSHAWPGVETPPAKSAWTAARRRLDIKDTATLVSFPGGGIDARHSVNDVDLPLLPRTEHDLQATYLGRGVTERLAPAAYRGRSERPLLTRHHATNIRFRRNTEEDVLFWYDTDPGHGGWRRIDEDTGRSVPDNRSVTTTALSAHARRRFLLDLTPEAVIADLAVPVFGANCDNDEACRLLNAVAVPHRRGEAAEMTICWELGADRRRDS